MTIDEQNLERKFLSLTNSQESVQTLSLWILHHKNHYKKIIQVWLRMMEKSKDKDKTSHRLTMFYLANDVIQNSKKKGCRQYVDGFKEVLKRSTQLVKDEKIAPKIDRMFGIWSQRNIYSEEFINDLKEILNGTSSATKATSKKNESNYASSNRVPTDFSLASLEKKAKDIESIDKTSTLLIGNLNLKKIDLINSGILAHLKDKKAGEQCCKELNEIELSLKSVVSSLQKQVDHRSAFLDTLEKCELFYETQNSEVKIVENAYKNFNLRVKGVKNKLNNNQSTYLSPFIDAPSPNSDDDDLLLADNSHSSGIKNLLNVLNDSSTKSNKISSLDNRLSNLQNLPVISTLVNNSNRDQHESNWPANQTQKPNFNLEQHNLSHQMSPHPFNPLINQPPPPPPKIMNQSHIPPPINVNHPPPFIPTQLHQQPPPTIVKKHNSHMDSNYYFAPGSYPPPPHIPPTAVAAKQLNEPSPNSYDYYNNSNKFPHHTNTNNNLYNNNNSRNTTSIQQIKSLVSTRNEQQLESNDSSLPYDPYDDVGPINTMEDFEPTDMELGNSDDEEMNRSSNSQRFLKVIETNNGNSSNNKPVPTFNNQQQYKTPSSHHQTSIHPQNLHPINPVPINPTINATTSHLNDFKPETSKLPPQLPLHITSSSLTTVTNQTSQLPNVQTYHQSSSFYNNKQPQNFNKFNSPAKGFISADIRQPPPPLSASKPRWTNANHQLTGSPMNSKPMFEQHQLTTNNPNSFNNMNNNQSMPAHSSNQYGSNRHQNNHQSNHQNNNNGNRPWKRNNNKNYNQHHHQNNRNRSFNNSGNLSYNSNNNVNLSNLSSISSINSVVSSGLNHQNQYQ